MLPSFFLYLGIAGSGIEDMLRDGRQECACLLQGLRRWCMLDGSRNLDKMIDEIFCSK